jgi:DNA-binding beta-propeller fold protein YncE
MNTIRRLRAVLAVLGLLLAAQAHAQSVYWIDTNFPLPKLGKANTDGTSPLQVALPVGSLPEGLAVDGGPGKLYWAEAAWSGAHLNSADLGLGGIAPLVSGGSSLRGVALDPFHGTIYWTSSNLVVGGQVHRANLDGSSPAVIASLGAGANPRGIAVDGLGGRVYWADYDQNAIYSSDLNGAGVAPVVNVGLTSPWGLALDPAGNQLFVTEYVPGRISRYQLPAGPLATVVGSLANPTYIAVDAAMGKMFWTEAGAGAQKVQRANLNGTLVQNLALPLATYGGIAIGPGEPTATLLLSFAADAVAGGIELRWRFSDPSRFVSVAVERADDPGVSWQVVDAALSESGGLVIALDRGVEAGRSYQYRLRVSSGDGTKLTFGPVQATAGAPVTEFALSAIAPNPTRDLARIEYAVAREARVRISVMDLQGRELVRLVDGVQTPGRHQALWTGETAHGRAPAGLYFVRYQTPASVLIRRLVIAR